MNLQLFASNRTMLNKSGMMVFDSPEDGLLNPEQANRFLEFIFEDDSFLSEITHETRVSPKGSLPTIGMNSRILRSGEENKDTITGNESKAKLGSIKYATKELLLGTSISEKFLRENAAQKNFKPLFLDMLAKQFRVDLLDLMWNGDEDTDESHLDYDFLSLDNGIIKQLESEGNILDASTYTVFTDDMFLDAQALLPSKYFDPTKFKWISNQKTYTNWLKHLKKRNTTAGDMALLGNEKCNPLNIPWERVANFPDGKILLINPKNIGAINTFKVNLKSTSEGKEALFKGERYYASRMDNDFIVYRKDAAVLINNIPEVK